MTKPRVTETNRLADVIEVVELGRRTGILMVERGSGDMLEEGAIFFQNGRATFAAVERVRGQDALSVLGGWGACRFSFDPNAARPENNLAPVGGAPAGGYATPTQSPTPTQPGRRDTSSPQNWYAPPSQAPAPNTRPVSPVPPSSQPSGPFSTSWPDLRAGQTPGSTNPNGVQGPASSGSLPLPQGWPQQAAPIPTPTAPNTSNDRFPAGMFGPPPPRPPARAEAGLLRRPRRASTASDLMAVVQNLGLSRAHRTVLMLADGEHNVLDMARLSSKQIEEVQALLGELEGHGLVYYTA